MTTTVNGTTGVSLVQDGIVTPSKLSQPMTLMTAQAASGTEVVFANIPSWAKRIVVTLYNLSSTAASAPMRVQLGTSGGVKTTGYDCKTIAFNSTPTITMSTSTDGIFATSTVLAASYINGVCTLHLHDPLTNIWQAEGTIYKVGDSVSTMVIGTGVLDSVLTTIKITCDAGTFDGGSINIMYEG